MSTSVLLLELHQCFGVIDQVYKQALIQTWCLCSTRQPQPLFYCNTGYTKLTGRSGKFFLASITDIDNHIFSIKRESAFLLASTFRSLEHTRQPTAYFSPQHMIAHSSFDFLPRLWMIIYNRPAIYVEQKCFCPCLSLLVQTYLFRLSARHFYHMAFQFAAVCSIDFKSIEGLPKAQTSDIKLYNGHIANHY